MELKLHWEPGQTYIQESDTDTTNFLTALGKTSDQKLKLHQTTSISVQKTAQGQTEAKVMIESLLGEMDGVDENDPRSLGRFMRRMAEETGEDVGPEFNEIIGRLERGEDPERIEQDMGDILGDEPSAGTDEPAAIEAEPTPKPKPARHRKTAATKSGVKKTTKKKK